MVPSQTKKESRRPKAFAQIPTLPLVVFEFFCSHTRILLKGRGRGREHISSSAESQAMLMAEPPLPEIHLMVRKCCLCEDLPGLPSVLCLPPTSSLKSGCPNSLDRWAHPLQLDSWSTWRLGGWHGPGKPRCQM